MIPNSRLRKVDFKVYLMNQEDVVSTPNKNFLIKKVIVMRFEQMMGIPMPQVMVVDCFGRPVIAPKFAPVGVVMTQVPVGIPVGIPIRCERPMPFAPHCVEVREMPRQDCRRVSAWEREIDRTTPLKMEVMEDRGSQLVETNKRLSPSELDFHMNRFNEMRAEKARKDAREAAKARGCAPWNCGCHGRAPWDDEDEDEDEDDAIEALLDAMARRFGSF